MSDEILRPYTERDIEGIREILVEKRRQINAGKHIEGADWLEQQERLVHTIDNLAERLRTVEGQSAAHLEVAATCEERALKRAIEACRDVGKQQQVTSFALVARDCADAIGALLVPSHAAAAE